MRRILLINPNSSEATTAMMVGIASQGLPPDFEIVGATAARGPSMIVNDAELAAAAAEVEQSWQQAMRTAGPGWAGIIVGAFGDPGMARLQAVTRVPVAGLCEASMREAAHGGRRFGVATVTPELVASIDARAASLGLGMRYAGTRLTAGDPRALAADAPALEVALASAVARCIEEDGAQAVIIGGGPLGQVAVRLAGRFSVPVIAPIPAAVRRVLALAQPVG